MKNKGSGDTPPTKKERQDVLKKMVSGVHHTEISSQFGKKGETKKEESVTEEVEEEVTKELSEEDVSSKQGGVQGRVITYFFAALYLAIALVVGLKASMSVHDGFVSIQDSLSRTDEPDIVLVDVQGNLVEYVTDDYMVDDQFIRIGNIRYPLARLVSIEGK